MIASCGNRDSRSKTMSKESAGANAFEEVSSKMNLSPTEQPTTKVPEATQRQLIKNGQLSFETTDVKKTKIEINNLCDGLKAYVSSETQNNSGDRINYSQVIRVPANQFDNLLSKIESLASKVDDKNITTEDVTEEFIDLTARLKTKKELESRYREILTQAKTVSDILAIESQIGSVRAEIESTEGRLHYIQNQVSLSTLTVTYYETIGTNFGFVSKFIHSLGEGWDNLLGFLIALTSGWPFVLTLVVGYFWWRRRRAKKIPG